MKDEDAIRSGIADYLDGLLEGEEEERARHEAERHPELVDELSRLKG